MTHREDQLNLHAARSYLTRLLPHLAPFTGQELQSLTLKAGLWSLYQHTRPPEADLTAHLQSHARLLRGQEGPLDHLEAQHLRQQAAGGPNVVPSRLESQEEAGADNAPRLEKMRQQAQRLGLPWFTRRAISHAKTQVSYRVTQPFEQALEEAWKVQVPRGGSRNALQATLALAYLSLPEFQRRVRRLQDVRYARQGTGVISEEAQRVAALLTRCRLPARGAPTLRNEVVQLSYRTTTLANNVLRRSLPAGERTLAYLHIDLLALYLIAPDVRAFIDLVIEERGQE
ncbi:hypothetical protein [Deinococcus apachensis]|uniref:hypothetical protein n=1 Tax=Deinococcus apachensis TaxID=309886 RepID=UPI0003600EDA|nr:hypothetical protein [Deinococcus apachensis]